MTLLLFHIPPVPSPRLTCTTSSPLLVLTVSRHLTSYLRTSPLAYSGPLMHAFPAGSSAVFLSQRSRRVNSYLPAQWISFVSPPLPCLLLTSARLYQPRINLVHRRGPLVASNIGAVKCDITDGFEGESSQTPRKIREP